MHNYFFFALIYGVMISMALYNLFIYVSLHHKIYLTYVLYMTSFFFYFSIMNGHMSEFMRLDGALSLILEWVLLGASIFPFGDFLSAVFWRPAPTHRVGIGVWCSFNAWRSASSASDCFNGTMKPRWLPTLPVRQVRLP